MKRTNIKLQGCAALLLTLSLLTACGPSGTANRGTLPVSSNAATVTPSADAPDHDSPVSAPLEYKVIPESFSLSVKQEDAYVTVSLPRDNSPVTNYNSQGNHTSWGYPDESVSVSISSKENYLDIAITSTTPEDNEFTWPVISGDTYYLPLGEGKRVTSQDPIWNNYLRNSEVSVMERLSMPFFSVVSGNSSVVVIMEHPYRSSLIFPDQSTTSFSLLHQYPEIDSIKEKHFRIYATDASPVSAAKIYRQYVKEKGDFVTLEQKAEANPDIRKLYGAPHIYLWGDLIISPDNINWPKFRKAVNSAPLTYLRNLFGTLADGAEAVSALEEMASQDYVSEYQKNAICRVLSEALKLDSFYDETIFPKKDQTVEELLNKGVDQLNESQLIQLNKHALAASLPEVFDPAGKWMASGSTDLIKDLKGAGINQAWIGLNSWEQAYATPELTASAIEAGYLIGSYDSYHSIHEPGKEQWITAAFPDTSLFETATVTNQKGSKLAGFQNTGRKLNPVLSLPSVKQRMDGITQTGIPFNSWFIDCDATGEIYDDYSPEHITTQEEDLQARLQRMSLIRDQYNMVIGSEGGNDFAASTIAFAHGIELQSFSWMDEDMKTNKDSPYYMGKYYSATGGVAERFAKPIPIKKEYADIFLNPAYDIPLYKLVYNDSVITTYHWDWSTFKITDAKEQRMLREILFNVPPLYHLDSQQWDTYEAAITSHTAAWSDFSKKAILLEMTDFEVLTEDGLVQMTSYGDSLKAVANYGTEDFQFEGQTISGKSILTLDDNQASLYSPSL